MGKLPPVGQVVTMKRVFHQADFDQFAQLSGDDNSIHVDPDFAAQTRFGRTVAHGMLLYGVICGLLSTHFPGARQVEQTFMFPAPTFTDEEVTVRAEVVAITAARQQARLTTTITNATGELTCEGESVLQWQQ